MGDVTVVQAILYIQWINCAIWFRWKAENRLKEIKTKNSNKKLQLVFCQQSKCIFSSIQQGATSLAAKTRLSMTKFIYGLYKHFPDHV